MSTDFVLSSPLSYKVPAASHYQLIVLVAQNPPVGLRLDCWTDYFGSFPFEKPKTSWSPDRYVLSYHVISNWKEVCFIKAIIGRCDDVSGTANITDASWPFATSQAQINRYHSYIGFLREQSSCSASLPAECQQRQQHHKTQVLYLTKWVRRVSYQSWRPIEQWWYTSYK